MTYFVLTVGGPIHGYAPVFNLTQFHLKGFLHLFKKKKQLHLR